MYCRNCGKELVGTPEICMNCGARPLSSNLYCPACGASTNAMAVVCVKCGAGLEVKNKTNVVSDDVSAKSRVVLLLLALFLGAFGAHRFYVGKIVSGIAMIVLLISGYAIFFFGIYYWIDMLWLIGYIPLIAVSIWWLIDFIMAICGSFKDKEGKLIKNWQN
jgi:TM2 domain-containing membrane protein YozV